jgi:hypothetical protein
MEQTGVNPFAVLAHGAFLNGQGVEGFSFELTGVGNWDPLSVLTPKYSATTIGTSQSFQESTDQYISESPKLNQVISGYVARRTP